MVLFDTESDAIKVCGTYDSVGYYVILYVSDTVMCMVLYDTVSECGFSHIFTSKGRGMVNIKLCSSAYFCLSEEACQRHVGYNSSN